MSGRAFSVLEGILLAIGFDKESLNILIAMLEGVMHVGGNEGPNVADQILKSYLVEASSLFKTLVRLDRSIDRFAGPNMGSKSRLIYNSFMGAASQKLSTRQPDAIFNDDRSRGANSTAKQRSPTSSAPPQLMASPSKKLKVDSRRADARSGGGSAELKQGSKANLVTQGGNGHYLRIGNTFYDLRALKADLVSNNSTFPIDYVHLALLKGPKSKTDKLAWCLPHTSVPPRAFQPPFVDFTGDNYRLGKIEPADF